MIPPARVAGASRPAGTDASAPAVPAAAGGLASPEKKETPPGYLPDGVSLSQPSAMAGYGANSELL